MKRFYTYTPKSRSRSKYNKKEQEYIKIIFRSLVYYVIIIVVSFFGFIAIFSNINNVWGFFRGKEIYVEDKNFALLKPFLKTDTEYTKEKTVTLEGTAQEGYKIYLYKNDQEISNTIADKENKYVFNDVEIQEDEKTKTVFYTIAKDDKNNESPKSNEVTVYFDKTKPKLTVKSPEPDERVKSFSRTLEVTGETEKDTEITVNGRTARINLNYEFSATIKLDDGVNTVTVIAKDKAENETKIEVPVYFEKID